MHHDYTTEQLKERGWTSLMIKAHLGKADEQRSDPNGQLRKTVKLYRIGRVHAARAVTYGCGVDPTSSHNISNLQKIAPRCREMR
jgi:hypothetical protein